MQLNLTLDVQKLPKPISYTNKIMLVGSCFTEHIAQRLEQNKFNTLSNPHGILFNPLSVSSSIISYAEGRLYNKNELFYLNELYNSWEHHTRFSDIDETKALNAINTSQIAATEFIAKADWIIITLGSAFQYYLKENQIPVSNNHRAPAQWFEKKLLPIDEIISSLSTAFEMLLKINPKIRIMLTISPVRHIRDGVIENNRSKARLIESVHYLCNNSEFIHYFPAYELIIDILRDYRFYDIDFVHPNFLATSIVWENFVESCISKEAQEIMTQVQEIVTARNHRPRFEETQAHKKFMENYLCKINTLSAKYPFINFKEETDYFSGLGK